MQNNPNTLIEKGGVLYAAVSEGQITIDQKIIDALLETIPDELKEGIHTILNKRRELTENRQPIDDLLEGLLKKIAEKKALTRTNASSQGLFQTQPGSIISEQKTEEEEPENSADQDQENQPNSGGGGKARPSI